MIYVAVQTTGRTVADIPGPSSTRRKQRSDFGEFIKADEHACAPRTGPAKRNGPFRGSTSRNKASVDEPAVELLPSLPSVS